MKTYSGLNGWGLWGEGSSESRNGACVGGALQTGQGQAHGPWFGWVGGEEVRLAVVLEGQPTGLAEGFSVGRWGKVQ